MGTRLDFCQTDCIYCYILPSTSNEGESTDTYSLYDVWIWDRTPQRGLRRGCETGLTVYCPYRRRPESLTVLHMSFERQDFRAQFFKDPECWSGRALNQRPPTRHTGAYPTELTGKRSTRQVLILMAVTLTTNSCCFRLILERLLR